MKKTFLAALISAASLSAQAEYFLVGSLGSTTSDQEVASETVFSSTREDNDTGSSGMLAVAGGLSQESYRVYAEYANTAYEDADISFITANADYLYTASESVSLFAGVGFGVAALSWNATDDTESLGIDGETATSGAVGFKFGGIVEAGEGAVEIGYRQFSSNLETEVTGQVSGFDFTVTSKVTNTSGIYVGYNVTF